jgi:hypothetical protein
VLHSRRLIVLFSSLALLILGWIGWANLPSKQERGRPAAPIIIKQPVVFTTQTFDPSAPPADMPPLPAGEIAECDSAFLSGAVIAGQPRRTDATHAVVTITQVKVTLQLNITVWVPTEATQHVIEHEEGHRQVSEYYYQDADKVAKRIADSYIGRQVDVTGNDLDAESNKMLQQMAADIADQYEKELNPEATQLLYDSITDHGRNEVIVQDAVAAAIKNVTIASIR